MGRIKCFNLLATKAIFDAAKKKKLAKFRCDRFTCKQKYLKPVLFEAVF